jgi:hypothetical protein
MVGVVDDRVVAGATHADERAVAGTADDEHAGLARDRLDVAGCPRGIDAGMPGIAVAERSSRR